MRFRLAFLGLGEIDDQQGAPFEKGKIERQCRDGAGGKPDHEVPSSPGDRAKSLYRHLAANRVKDDIRAMAADQPLERISPIRPCVVYGLVGAETNGEV